VEAQPGSDHAMTTDEFFFGRPVAKKLFAAVSRAVESVGKATMRVTKSQIAFRRRHNFASVWLPAQYLKGRTAPLVLTIFLGHQISSARWKQIVKPAPGRFTHHLELYDAAEIDEEVRSWLHEAWEAAG
jgi:hypothetical protein